MEGLQCTHPSPQSMLTPPAEPIDYGHNAAQGIRLAWDYDTAGEFKFLPGSESLVLLTPAIVPGVVHDFTPMLVRDHFIPLASAFGKSHFRTRHVPYLIPAGIDKRVNDWLDECPHVVVVVAEPGVSNPQQYAEVMRFQQEIVRKVVTEYYQIHEGIETHALAVVYFGNADYQPPPGVPVCLKFPPYGSFNLRNVSRALLRQR